MTKVRHSEQGSDTAIKTPAEAMPPSEAGEGSPAYQAHADGYHSHKHTHGEHAPHYHRHRHAGGERPHSHGADDPIDAEHPDHRRQHVGG